MLDSSVLASREKHVDTSISLPLSLNVSITRKGSFESYEPCQYVRYLVFATLVSQIIISIRCVRDKYVKLSELLTAYLPEHMRLLEKLDGCFGPC